MRAGRSPGFEEFVLAHSATLHHTTVLLTGDSHTARDLLQEALLSVWGAWSRIQDNHLAYARTTVVRAYLTDRRRRWHGEMPTAELPEPPERPGPDVATRLTL